MDGFYSDIWRAGASFDWGLLPGEIFASSSRVGDIQISSVSPASGGEGSITYQWYYSTSLPSGGDYGSIVSGATSTALVDSNPAVSGGSYYYTRLATDSVGRQAAVTTNVLVDFARSWNIDHFALFRRKSYIK